MLDKITEDSFTKTGKGLITLFCVGMIQLVLSVKLENVTIAIPWFPEVHFENPERISILFISLVVYASIRYWLYTNEEREAAKIESLAWGLQNTLIGRNMIQRYIFSNEDRGFNVSPILADNTQEHSKQGYVRIYSYSFEDSPSENFNIYYKNASLSQVIAIISREGQAQGAINDAVMMKKWGLRDTSQEGLYQQEIEEGESQYYSYRISNMRLRFIFTFNNYYFLARYSFIKPNIFDYFMPLGLNFILIIAWLYIKLPMFL